MPLDSTPYSCTWVRSTTFGVLAGVVLPDGLDPVPEPVLARLHPPEQAQARCLFRRRQIEWVGGRLAFREALSSLGAPAHPLLTGQRGEPLLPPGLTGSVSHKRHLAVALVTHSGQGTVGVDLEEGEDRPRMTIASRVLRPEEQAAVQALPLDHQWPAVLARFAVKEAFYKAVHPHLQRYVGFEEAAVHLGPDTQVLINLFLNPPARFQVEASLLRQADKLMALCRVR